MLIIQNYKAEKVEKGALIVSRTPPAPAVVGCSNVMLL